jgi:hypothetical protein
MNGYRIDAHWALRGALIDRIGPQDLERSTPSAPWILADPACALHRPEPRIGEA